MKLKKKENNPQIFSYSPLFRTFSFDGSKPIVSNSCIQKLRETKYSAPELVILTILGKCSFFITIDDSFGLDLAELILFGECNVTISVELF